MLTFSSGFTPDGKRIVAGVVALDATKTYVMLVRRKGRQDKGWIFPRGGWESDEEFIHQAVEREALEESGVSFENAPVSVGETLSKDSKIQYYEVQVSDTAENWKEQHRFERKWASYAEAKELLAWRKDQVDILEKSGINRDS